MKRINLNPKINHRLCVRPDGICRTLRLTHTTVNTFIRMNDQHVLTFIKTIHRTYLYTICVFTSYAIIIYDICHFYPGRLMSKKPHQFSTLSLILVKLRQTLCISLNLIVNNFIFIASICLGLQYFHTSSAPPHNLLSFRPKTKPLSRVQIFQM